MLLGIHWESWNIFPIDKGDHCSLYSRVRVILPRHCFSGSCPGYSTRSLLYGRLELKCPLCNLWLLTQLIDPVGHQALQRLPLHIAAWHSAKDFVGPLCIFLEFFFCLVLSSLLFCPANSSHLRSPELWSLSPQLNEIALLPLDFTSVPWSRKSLQAEWSWGSQQVFH